MDKQKFRLNLVDEYFERVNFPEELQEYYSTKNTLVTGGAGAIAVILQLHYLNLLGKRAE